MSKEKQIVEIAKTLCSHYNTSHCGVCDHLERCMVRIDAEWIYSAGYRKQEWISVDERLPEVSNWYIVNVIDIDDHVSVEFVYYSEEHSWYNANKVTHWMHRPEVPRKFQESSNKGGE